jgi:hypothetical protein
MVYRYYIEGTSMARSIEEKVVVYSVALVLILAK